MAGQAQRLPLFPLGIVLLPGEVVPLHIFEERYKLMIGECLDHEREFGIVWVSQGGLREVGCSARITEVIERMADGRMNILVRGARPFRLLRRIVDMPYPAGDVELLDEEQDGPQPEVAAAARGRYADLIERVTDSRPSDSDLTELDAYEMAATIGLPLESKQEVLELRSERERLRRVGELLETTLGRLEQGERIAELARSNGRGRR